MEYLARWRTERGHGSAVRRSSIAVLITAHGHLDAQPGMQLLRVLEEALVTEPGAHFFCDFGTLDGYHSSIRVEGIRILVKHRRALHGVTFYTRSKVAMIGIAMAHLALPGMIRTFTEPDQFALALQRVIEGDMVGPKAHHG